MKCMVEEDKRPFQGPLSKKVARMPVMRGNLGEGSEQWNIAGSGRKVDKTRKWIKERTLPYNWKEILGIPFVEYVEISKFSFYLCPICQESI